MRDGGVNGDIGWRVGAEVENESKVCDRETEGLGFIDKGLV